MRLILAATALAAFVSSPALSDMTETERATFRDEVRAYLLENPEVIVEALDILQSRDQANAATRDRQLVLEQHAAIFDDPTSWSGGNPDGDVTIVEFVDYRCGYCRKAHDEVAELVASDGNIRLVLKEFPILGEASMTASRFAVSVLQLHGAEAYKAVHDRLITLRGEPDQAALTRLATELGHDATAILARMASDDVTDVIRGNHALADAMAISGTPTFVVQGTMLRGYVPLDQMRAVVAQERG